MKTVNDIMNYVLARRPLMHILYWLAVYGFLTIYSLGFGRPVKVSFFVILIDLPIQIIATYFLLYLQLPLLLKRRYILFIVYTLLLSYVFYLGVHFNNDYGIGTYLISWHKPHTVSEILLSGEFIMRNLVDIYIVVLITAIIKYIKNFLDSRGRIEILEAELADVQYQSLLGKIDPQLILDSLDRIILKSEEDSKELPQIIANLSEVLDGVLYKTRNEHHSLRLEIEQVKLYVHLFSQVYPEHQLGTFDLMISAPTTEVAVMSLKRPVALLFNQLKEVWSTTRFDVLVIDDAGLIIQLYVHGPLYSDQILADLKASLVYHFAGTVQYDILEEGDDLIIKMTVAK